MCFYLQSTYGKIPITKVEEEDIIVWKSINKDNSGWLYSLVINGWKEKWTKGFHYIETTPFKSMRWNYSYGYWEFFGNCFHSKKTKQEAESITCSDEKVVKMIIPKNSLFYENKYEYISSEIIYPK